MSSLVSVIIPVYNVYNYINECIDSVLDQAYDNIEIILVDDGSDDGTLPILEDYAEKHDNISLYRQNRQNASIARNRGMEHAKGEYYIFLDSDDRMMPGSVKLLVDTIKQNKADFVMGNIQDIDVDGNPIAMTVEFKKSEHDRPFTDYLSLAPGPSNKLYRADIIKENNIVFANVRIAQDLNFYYKYLSCCKNIITVPEIIYQWRDVPTGMSRTLKLNIFDITASFEDIYRFMAAHDMEETYEKYVRTLEFFHYYRQMEKQYTFSDRKTRKLIVDFFQLYIGKLKPKLSKCANIDEYRHSIKACNIKLVFKYLYISELYAKHKNKQLKNT